MIVGASQSGAFLWDEVNGARLVSDILTDLGVDSITGWHLEEARAITPDGNYIAGIGRNPDGVTEAWVVI